MDTIHAWALWRLVMIGLVALPFLVAVVVASFRQRRTDAPNATSGLADRSAPTAIWGPDAWHVSGEGRVENPSVDSAAVVKKRAA
jgi:hypothetical protein